MEPPSRTAVRVTDLPSLSCYIESEMIAFVTFHKASNFLDKETLRQLNYTLGSVRAVVFYSRSKHFILGADMMDLQNVATASQGRDLSRKAQTIFDRIQGLRVPTLAAISGLSVGIGLELALACTLRVSSDSALTRLGSTEIRFGLTPGGGGTVRLPRVVGPAAALELILGGHTIDAETARSIGLVDSVLPSADRWSNEHRFFHEVRKYMARRIEDVQSRPRLYRSPFVRFWERSWIGRQVIRQAVLWRLSQSKTAHGPSVRGKTLPVLALDTVLDNLGRTETEAFLHEARVFGRNLMSPHAQNLMSLFFMVEDSKKLAQSMPEGVRVDSVGIVGAGTMGRGIAVSLALHGRSVYITDRTPTVLKFAIQSLRDLVKRLEASRSIGRDDAARVLERIKPVDNLSGLADANVILETATEDLGLKLKILADLESLTPATTVIATNTSSLSINRLARELAHPQRFIGAHFMYPAEKMPLVEIIRNEQSSESAVATMYRLALHLEKTPVVVGDGPGFVLNRILSAYVVEACQLLSTGGSIVDIDNQFVEFGLPKGPFRLMDDLGLDMAVSVAAGLEKRLGARFKTPQPLVDVISGSRRAGRKSGLGFYEYTEPVGSSRVDLQACKLEYSIVSPK